MKINLFEKTSTEILRFKLAILAKQIWFRTLIYAFIGVLTAFLGLVVGPYIPDSTVTKIGSSAVGNILTILATSMLTVATFSLSIMVTAFGNVSNAATPRASRLLMSDQKSQSAVATFVGAFLFSIVGIISLTTESYTESGRFVLFLATVLVIGVIVVTLIKWIGQLAQLGRIADTIGRIEAATSTVFRSRSRSPTLGCSPTGPVAPFKTEMRLRKDEAGFLCFIDTEKLHEISSRLLLKMDIRILPGQFYDASGTLIALERVITPETQVEILSCFVIDASRTFEQDPRYGLVMLAEVSSKALSPGINDPGTAIEALGAVVRLFQIWSRDHKSESNLEIKYPLLYMTAPDERDLFEDFFGPICRDGAGMLEVAIKIQKALIAIANYEPSLYRAIARQWAVFGLAYSEQKLCLDFEKDALRSVWRSGWVETRQLQHRREHFDWASH